MTGNKEQKTGRGTESTDGYTEVKQSSVCAATTSVVRFRSNPGAGIKVSTRHLAWPLELSVALSLQAHATLALGG